MAPCFACDLASGVLPLPGGRVWETEHWIVEHCVGPLPLGTLIVKPKRHVLYVAAMTAAEAGELGGLLQQTAEIVTELVRPEQVYTCLWSHIQRRPQHIHFVVQPVGGEEVEQFGSHGPTLQSRMLDRGFAPAVDAIEQMAERARERFESRACSFTPA